MQTKMEHPNSEYPLLSVFFTLITWALAAIDAIALDQSIFQPLAHIATIASGTVAVTLFFFSMKDRLKKK